MDIFNQPKPSFSATRSRYFAVSNVAFPKGEGFHFRDDQTLDLEKGCEFFHRRFAATSFSCNKQTIGTMKTDY